MFERFLGFMIYAGVQILGLEVLKFSTKRINYAVAIINSLT